MSTIPVFETRVAGIPCQVEVTYFEPTRRASRRGHPDNWDEDEQGYIEYVVLDRGGRPAPWLEVKMKQEDHRRVDQEISKRIEAYA